MNDEIVAGTSSSGQLRDWSLVLSAMDIPHSVMPGDGGERLIMVEEAEEAVRAREEISLFEAENRNWPMKAEAMPEQERKPPTLVIMALFVLFYAATGDFDGQSFWFEDGAADGGRFMKGREWWRAVTALTLHADAVHLAGNVLIGGMLIHFLSIILGAGATWLSLIVCGGLANCINMLARGSDHVSIGFSTAVFAAVGILAAMNCWRRGQFKGVLLSLGAGSSLLAMLGTSGERVDLGAHLWGFVTGLLAGTGFGVWIWSRRPLPGPGIQGWLLAGASALVLWCWHMALS